jgi:hypothetical protein
MVSPLRLSVLGLAAVAALTCAACSSSSGGTGSGTGTGSDTGASTPAPNSSGGVATTTQGATQGSTPGATTDTSSAAPGSSSSSAPGGGGSASSIVHPGWCVDGEITTSAENSPDGGAAGHNGVLLLFKNSSPRTCVLYGYPGADALDSAGHTVAHAARSLTGYIGGQYSGLHNVSLAPGATASTYVEGDIGDGGADCSAGTTMVVTPPNLFHPTPVSLAPYVCAFTIHPVVAGSTGR